MSSTGTATPDAELEELLRRHRRELLAHCYRMVGSASEAEDMVQETYLRAWKAYDAFEGRSSVRTWLYRIATNVCLSNLEGRDRRPLPTGLGAPSLRADAPLVEREIPWLGPLPDALVTPADPAEIAVEMDSVRLAFVAALQLLPAKQRAVLILCEVLRWSAAEAAEALETSVAAVNSALQRARATMGSLDPSDSRPAPLDERQRQMLDAYVAAFWRKDVHAIAALLTRDAVWEMPPWEGWYQGADTIGALIDTNCPGQDHDMPMLPTRANGQPAFGLYMREACLFGPDSYDRGEGLGDVFVPFQLHVLELAGDKVSHVVAFFDPEAFALAGLPAQLTAGDVAAIAPLTPGS
ncbi:MAG: sigma-70 family RNA polymerase sigma factor [Nocardioidaceae bacterium]